MKKLTPKKLSIPVVGAILVALLAGGTALAAFTANRQASVSVSAATVLTMAAPTAAVSGDDATISFAQGQLSDNRNVTSYQLERTKSGGGTATVTCNSSPCSDNDLAEGSYTYKVRGKYQQWTGAYSAASNSITVAAAPAAFTPTGLGSTEGAGTANRQGESGDSIVIDFSSPVLSSSICGNWDGTTRGGNNEFVVRFNNGPSNSNDTITFHTSSNACGSSSGTTVNIGTIDLGSSGYVAGTVNFQGTGSNATTISLDAAGDTLTIKLGNNNTTTSVAPANTNAKATFTPSGNIKSTGNVTISGTVDSAGLLF